MRTKVFTLVVALLATWGYGQKQYLQCGHILDVEKGRLQAEKTLVVEGNRILEILDGYQEGGDSDTRIDLRGFTVLPGLIDMHVHIESESSPQTYIKRFTSNPADIAYEAAVYAERTLMAGFTTVRDLGGTGVNIALRKAVDRGLTPGPRIYTAGKSIATTGGHADPTNGRRLDEMGNPGPKEGVVNSPEEGRQAVRQRYKEGSDVIKITATGGVLSVAKNGQNPQFTVEEIRAITQTARDYGMLAAAHAHGDEGMQRAILGGINTIEHGTLMSEQTMALMKEHGVYMVPTISAGKEAARLAEVPGYFPEVVAQKAREIGPQIQNTFSKAYRKGVPIAFGTDAGVFKHGTNAQEFGYMVEAGMPAAEALRAATITNATLLGAGDRLGQLKPGYLADIIAVSGNPLEDVGTLMQMQFVMKDGVVYLP
ncbi:amidohydrolase family protein [Robiginitalea sp. M366]|uniref:metal-dependent hydrolase family protein n=1 Tax=Robiginitalea aestuariiviva TaxID=3036903 RepID=UPI00240E9376|nr:amidohydrolase family protein [Robiginitalea aestuariiviva]MDG1571071.1 amidohydrolase family protein [Robiginitalea aestuariiviva]